MTRDPFLAGMRLLAATFERELPKERIKAYAIALRDMTDEDFTGAVDRLVAGWKSTPSEMFPLPATILAYARPYTDPAADAVALFEQVRGLGDYLPTGTRWSMAKIGQQLGWAAAEAFSAAGGSSAFEHLTERDLPFTRKAFVDAYVRACDAATKRLAPPVTERPALITPRLKALADKIGNGPDFKRLQAGDA